MISLSAGEYTAIVAFIRPQLSANEKHLADLKRLLRKDKSGTLRPRYEYTRNYVSTCRHLLALAAQKAGVIDDEPKRNQGHVA